MAFACMDSRRACGDACNSGGVADGGGTCFCWQTGYRRDCPEPTRASRALRRWRRLALGHHDYFAHIYEHFDDCDYGALRPALLRRRVRLALGQGLHFHKAPVASWRPLVLARDRLAVQVGPRPGACPQVHPPDHVDHEHNCQHDNEHDNYQHDNDDRPPEHQLQQRCDWDGA